ncbi:MAG: DNA polymerase III subunit alpha [Candidatus Peregrinibacteria bacterium]
MSQYPFVHLHLHSYYSLLDGLSKPADYVKKAAEQGCPAIALTDHGVMHGAIEFYKACQEHNIKPIIGCEVYVAFSKLTDKRPQIDSKRTHCTLLAETQEGYENLLKMTTVAHLDGYYYKPRVDWDLFKKYSKGLIALSGCLKGDMAEAILTGDDERVKELIERFQSIFGKKNFFLELQDHPTLPAQQTVNEKLIQLGKKHKIPLVATEDCHYVNPGDNEAQDIMICIQSGKNLSDTNRLTMMDADFSMRDPEELYKAFKDVPEAIENTLKIAERCHVEFELGVNRIPSFPVPEGKDPAKYLRELCFKGLISKYRIQDSEFKVQKGQYQSSDDRIQAMFDRLDYELKIITDMGFTGYFLIVWDFVKWAKDQGIVVGPGRGSAAGALVSYALDITEIDPLKYSLLFERFLNPARISMPDIDLDFADNRRDEVIDYVAEKYGRDKVAQICTFGTLAARAAVKDVGRTLGVPFVEMNEFAKLIPERPGTKLKEALEQSPELRGAIEKTDIFKQVIDNALKLEGAVRHVSVHACAVVIADEPLTKYTALQRPPKDDQGIITQYSAKPLEALGLLKMDFLGLKNLTILQTALKIIERTKGKKINLKEISMDNKKTYALLSRGETTGVFQLESGGMKRYLKELKPTEFEDIIAMVALFRPGPMEWIPDYIAGKHGKKKVSYIHPSLEPLLKNTYGIAIYQEQILQIAQEFAGFSLGEADILRRAIGKKIVKELEAQREKFIEGAIKKGYDQRLAVTIFEKVIEPFAGYGFNKSHAACYALIAYQTAYLKAHYPTEFMTALMSADADNTDRIVIEIGECEQMGIQVLPPDVNESRANFTVVTDDKIRFGLSAIKGLGQNSVDMVIDARGEEPFRTIADFAARVPAKILNKKTIEALAFGGAMENLGERNQIGLNYETIADFGKGAESSIVAGQAGLFDAMEDHVPASDLTLENVPPAPAGQRLKWEKEYLGLYVSAHPLAGLTKYFKQKTIPLDELDDKKMNKPIKVGGIITGMRKIVTKKGDMMAILQIEDPFGRGVAVVFPNAYRNVGDQLLEDHVIFIEGILERRMGEMQVVAKQAQSMPLEELQEQAKKEGLWTEGEKITRSCRRDLEEADVAEAEAVLEVPDAEVAELHDDSLFTNKAAHQILVNRDVDKQFFVELKTLFEKHPGLDQVELVIGERVVPVPLKVTLNPELQAQVDELIKKA